MEDILLFHGSRGGIEGNIAPISRVRCDFGQGFYMGESEDQAKGLIVEDSVPILYQIKLKLSEIPEDKILIVDNKDWLYTVLSNRKKVSEFNELAVAKKWLRKLEKYDVIIGPIAGQELTTKVASL